MENRFELFICDQLRVYRRESHGAIQIADTIYFSSCNLLNINSFVANKFRGSLLFYRSTFSSVNEYVRKISIKILRSFSKRKDTIMNYF